MNQSHIGGVGSITTIAGVSYVRIHARDIQVGDEVRARRVVAIEAGKDDYRGRPRVTVVCEGMTHSTVGAFGRVSECTTEDATFDYCDDEAVQIRQR